MGRDLLAREVKRRRLDAPEASALDRAARTLGLENGRGLEASIGRGDVAIGQVMQALYPDLTDEDLREPKPTVFGRMLNRIRLGRGIKKIGRAHV